MERGHRGASGSAGPGGARPGAKLGASDLRHQLFQGRPAAPPLWGPRSVIVLYPRPTWYSAWSSIMCPGPGAPLGPERPEPTLHPINPLSHPWDLSPHHPPQPGPSCLPQWTAGGLCSGNPKGFLVFTIYTPISNEPGDCAGAR